LGVDNFGLQILEVRVVEGESPFERSIGHAFLALEQVEYLGEYFIERHGRPLYTGAASSTSTFLSGDMQRGAISQTGRHTR